MPIEGVIHLQSHSIPLTYSVPSCMLMIIDGASTVPSLQISQSMYVVAVIHLVPAAFLHIHPNICLCICLSAPLLEYILKTYKQRQSLKIYQVHTQSKLATISINI